MALLKRAVRPSRPRTTPIALTPALHERLRCPICGGRLRDGERQLLCTGAGCGAAFPIVDGVPVLINEANSVFAIADFSAGATPFFPRRRRLLAAADRLIPDISINLKAEENYRLLARLLRARPGTPRVLILGGSVEGRGIAALLRTPGLEIVETDVAFGPRTRLICDAHDIPFADETFDAVVAQCVLEHVADPPRCVAEIERVLRPDGLIYVETPFMEQVHGGRYDFTRYTPLGHRRLLRGFEEIRAGAAGGPGMALAWSIYYLLLSFCSRPATRRAAYAVGRWSAFWLKHLDRLLIDREPALDAAAQLYFLGRKSARRPSEREIAGLYRGGFYIA